MYHKLKEQQQQEINNFPLMFAFNEAQFKEGCKMLEVSEPAKELYSIGAGGYLRKADSPKFEALIDRLNAEMAEALTDYDFLLDALIYELGNHEYIITADPGPALSALNFTVDDVKKPGQLQRAFDAAIKEIIGGHYDAEQGASYKTV